MFSDVKMLTVPKNSGLLKVINPILSKFLKTHKTFIIQGQYGPKQLLLQTGP